MDFDESVRYLYSLGNEVETMKLGLGNIRKLLAALGDPQNNYLKVQVAGTNGKGSVCAFLNSICLEASIETGVFTSPHLVSITERVNINGRDTSEKNFARHATRVRETAERLVAAVELETTPTFFEQVTAIALVAFAEARVQLAILETGLGGRLDATTAANAEIAAITRIDYDHQEHLGDTIEEIAAEKAAIIHKDSRVIIGEQLPEVMAVIRAACRQRGVEPFLVSGTTAVSLGLPGRHQIENAKVAILLAEELQLHFPITTENIIHGLENARHPGRLEYHGRYLFDGAHNVCGAKSLVDFLDEFEKRPITLIFGAMKDKDLNGITKILFPKAENLILTSFTNSRSATPDDLAKYVVGNANVFTVANITEALEIAARFSDNLVCVTGSLYLVGEARKTLIEI